MFTCSGEFHYLKEENKRCLFSYPSYLHSCKKDGNFLCHILKKFNIFKFLGIIKFIDNFSRTML
jgi:hypothetical protein